MKVHQNTVIINRDFFAGLSSGKKVEALGFESLANYATGEEPVEISQASKPNQIIMDINHIGKTEAVRQVQKEVCPIIHRSGNSNYSTLFKPIRKKILKKTLTDI